MRSLLFLLVGSVCAFAAEPQGIRPRTNVSDYPVHSERERLALGAALLSPEEVRANFVSDLNARYLVVEVAIYPRGEIQVSQADFSLLVAGSKITLRPVGAKTIAGVLQKTAPSTRDVTVSPGAGVGYGTGPRTYDPVTGRTRGGIDTSVGVGVGVGSTRPGSTDADRKTMELELSDKTLPAGRISQPVSGYLYFPAPAKKKTVTYDLEFRMEGDKIVLPLMGRAASLSGPPAAKQ